MDPGFQMLSALCALELGAQEVYRTILTKNPDVAADPVRAIEAMAVARGAMWEQYRLSVVKKAARHVRRRANIQRRAWLQ